MRNAGSGSIFGAGGGAEAGNAEFLSELQAALGDEQGRAVWEDFMPFDDPEAPTTIEERFEYGAFTGGDVTGSVVIDAGSLVSLDPRATDAAPEGIMSTDQRDDSLFDVRQQGILLRFVEAMNLVDEQQRASSARGRLVASLL